MRGLSSAGSWPATDACPHPTPLEYGTGCVCTSSLCGTYPQPSWSTSPNEAVLLTTSPEHGFLQHTTLPVTSAATSRAAHSMDIDVDPTSTFQEILGFGAAVTDAVAFVLSSLEPGASAELLRQAFEPSCWAALD